MVIKEKIISKAEKKILLLMGLDCNNCAMKIENEVKNIEGVKSASVDFVSQKLILEIKHKRESEKIVEDVIKIASRIEPGIKVVDTESLKKKNITDHSEKEGHSEENEEEDGLNKAEMLRLGFGFVLFLIGIVFKFSEIMEFSIFFVSYLLVGSEVIVKAVKNISRGQVFDENFLMGVATVGAFAIGQYPEGVCGNALLSGRRAFFKI